MPRSIPCRGSEGNGSIPWGESLALTAPSTFFVDRLLEISVEYLFVVLKVVLLCVPTAYGIGSDRSNLFACDNRYPLATTASP